MGVETTPMVVKGYYFTNKDKGDIPDEDWEDIIDNENVVSVSPMVNDDFIFGELVVELEESPCKLENYSPQKEIEIFEKLPESLKEKAKDFGTYCFICYH